MKMIILLLIFLSFFSFSKSEKKTESPQKKHDKRIKIINFKANQVHNITAFFGYSTHITLLKGDKVEQVALGDPEAWEIKIYDNNVFIKPIAEDPKTNMTILTNKRVYNFSLKALWPEDKSEIIFQIIFKQLTKDKITKPLEIKKVRPINDYFGKKKPKNWDYWFKGEKDLKPDVIFDDGRFTFLKFANNKEMPAIYVVSNDESESLINTHINPLYPDVIAIHSVREKMILRKGNSALCVINKSFDKTGISTKSGTTTPLVQRVLKD